MQHADVEEHKILEIFSTYFANCYWNNLYNEALLQYEDGKFPSQAAAYRYVIKTFNVAFCELPMMNGAAHQGYTDIMRAIYENYKRYTLATGTYDQFIEMVIDVMLPKEYHTELCDNRRKHPVMHDILSKTMTRFSTFATTEGITSVLDINARTTKRVAELTQWKNKFSEFFRAEINTLCGLLLAKNSGVNLGNPSNIPTIPLEICDKLKIRIRELIQDKADITERFNKCVKYIAELKQIIERQTHDLDQLRSAQNAAKVTAMPNIPTETIPISAEEDLLAVLDIAPLSSDET